MADEFVKKDEGVSSWVWWIPALLAVVGLVTAIGISASKRATTRVAREYSVHPETKRIQVSIGETVTFKIYPDYWVGPIEIPANAIIDENTPGYIEYNFWKVDKRVFCRKGIPQYLDITKDKKFRSFWLRGDGGEVRITARARE